jgi:hypothetical protein
VKFTLIALAAVASILDAAPRSAASPPPNFYTQSVEVNGVTIRGSSKVDKATMETVKARVAKMLANAPTITANFKAAKMELHVFARSEKITDLPEYAAFAQAATVDDNSFEHRFHGGKPTGTSVACSEENVMRDKSDPYPNDYDVCTHELAHSVLEIGVDPAARLKVIARYHAALGEGLYDGVYAGSSFNEFFAEASAHYFGYSGGGLQKSDPTTFALLDSLYGGSYANAPSPVTDLKALTGTALTSAHSNPDKGLTGLMLKNKSGTVVRVCELDDQGNILAMTARMVPNNADDSLPFNAGETAVLIDEKTKGIIATLAMQPNYGRFSIDDKMLSAERQPTPDELTRASAPIRVSTNAQ